MKYISKNRNRGYEIMKAYMVCAIAYSYGISLCKARRYTEEEKKAALIGLKKELFR